MPRPEIALLLSTYQRPGHLRRALASIALQQGVLDRMELVVTDDGSTDETAQVVADFSRTAAFPVRFTTHPHTTFRLSRCRNEGVAASSAPYLLFLDGDCVLPPDHARIHLERRKPNTVMAGDCVRLDEASSERLTQDAIRTGGFGGWASREELARLRKQDRRARLYRFLRHPTKPKIIGNNVGIWRSDYERVNGYDENFKGWGCEDDDLRLRLRRAGVQIESILRWTHTYHLWHPVDKTQPKSWREGANVQYLLRKGRLTRCRNGLLKRDLADICFRVIGDADLLGRNSPLAENCAGKNKPEVEILVLPGGRGFTGRADCNILVACDDTPRTRKVARQAHFIVGLDDFRSSKALRFPANEVQQALDAVA